MKQLHRPGLFAWSTFDESKNIDFNGTLWVREGGNVVIDPMPMTPHDQAHLEFPEATYFRVACFLIPQ